MDRRVVRVIAAATFFFTVAVGAILSILPVYMVEVLGATALVVGVTEGLASAVEAVTLVFSGTLSDRLGRRKPLAVLGYGLYLLIKPVFILAGQLWIIAAARIADRFSIAVFAAPQQALIGDVSAAGGRGAAFGLRAAADGLGAMTGPALATVALGALGFGYGAVFWIALLAAALAFAAALLWGGHGGLSVGLLAAMAAAGALWDALGPAAMFDTWAALSAAVLAGVVWARGRGLLPP